MAQNTNINADTQISTEPVKYIEPNIIDTYNNGEYEKTPDLEDFSIYVNLKVEVKKRYTSNQNEGNKVYSITWDGNSSNVNFMQGTRLYFDSSNKNGGYVNSFTTNYADYSYEDLSNGATSTTEMFGIRSIDINYDNFYVPQVTIEFIDIRGMSLFSPEEYSHNQDFNGIDGVKNSNISDSFFNSFFTFPYPMFTMIVKGFYGTPISYELNCTEWKANFDCKDGNFGCTATFIGYSFALLSDITFNMLCAAPLTSQGKRYWINRGGKPTNSNDTALTSTFVTLNSTDKVTDGTKEKLKQQNGDNISSINNAAASINAQSIDDNGDSYSDRFVFADNGQPMCTFKEFLDNMASGQKEAQKITGTMEEVKSQKAIEDELYHLQGIQASLIDVITPFNNIYQGASLLSSSDIVYSIYHFNSANNQIPQGVNDIINKINEFNNSLGVTNSSDANQDVKSITGIDFNRMAVKFQMAKFERFADSQIYLDNKYIFDELLKANKINGDEYVIYVDAIKLSQAIKDRINEDNNKNDINKSTIEQRSQDIIKSYLNFTPCVQNFGKMICAHIETLMHLLYDTVDAVTGFSDTRTLSLMNLTNSDCPKENDVPPFPKVVVQNADNPSKLEDGWLEDVTKTSTPETKLVMELLRASTNLSKAANEQYDSLSENSYTQPTLAVRGKPIMSNPILPCDLLMNDGDKMFGEIDLNDTHGVIKSIINRYVLVRGTYIVGKEYSNDGDSTHFLKICAQYDAQSFYNMYNNTNTAFYTTIKSNAFEGKPFYQWLIGEGYDKIYGMKINIYDNFVPYKNYNPNMLKATESNSYINGYSKLSMYGSRDSSEYNRNVFDNITQKIQYIFSHGHGFDRFDNNIGGTVNKLTYEMLKDIIGFRNDKWFISFSSHTNKSLIEANGENMLFEENSDIFISYFLLTALSKINLSTNILDDLNELNKLIAGSPSKSIKYCNEFTIILIGAFLYNNDKFKNLYNINAIFQGVNNFVIALTGSKNTILIENIKNKYINFKNKFISLFSDWMKQYNEEYKGKLESNVNLSNFNQFIRLYFDKIIKLFNNKLKENVMFVRYQYDNKIPYNKIFYNKMTSPQLEYFNLYMADFMNEIRRLMNKNKTPLNTQSNQTINALNGTTIQNFDITTHTDAKIAMYNYLKLIYDRWICGLNGDERKKWDIENLYGKRFKFIDSFYYKIGKKAMINPQDEYARILSSLKQDSYSVISFISEVLGNNNMSFMCVQNFLDLSKGELVESAFTPFNYEKISIEPNPQSDFIFLYTYEPSHNSGNNSEYEEKDNKGIGDSFLITGNTVDSKLPEVINAKTSQNGYRIPCFGVTFGKQYQNYFQNIQVNMDSPTVTEQVIKTQYMLANMAGNSAQGVQYVGQDLFTIYSNYSFNCQVTMMGCGWIQPTMYFSLNNIPLFRGTYMIFKVSHHIEPGNFTTTFSGNRLSRIATPLVKSWCVNGDYMQNGDYTQLENKIANIDNDCNYAYFLPSSMLIGSSSFNAAVKSLYNATNVHSQLSGILQKEASANLEDSALMITCLINRYLSNWGKSNHDWDKIIKSVNGSDWGVGLATNESNSVLHNLLSTNSVLSIAKMAKPSPDSPSQNAGTIVNKIDSWNGKGAKCADVNHGICNGQGILFKHSFLGSEQYFGTYDNKLANNGHVYWRNDGNNIRSNNEFNLSKECIGLWRAIKETCDINDSTKDAKISLVMSENRANQFTIKCEKNGANVFDAILMTYWNEISTLSWVMSNNDNPLSEPQNIIVNPSNGKTSKLIIFSRHDRNNKIETSSPLLYSQINEKLRKTLKKGLSKYGDTMFKAYCKMINDFSQLTDNIENCYNILSSNGNGNVKSCNNKFKSSDGYKLADMMKAKYSPIGGKKYYITAGFGTYSRLHKKAHEGVDFDNKESDKVYAIADGTIIFSGGQCGKYDAHGYGNLILIRHDNIKDNNGGMLYSLYGHLMPGKNKGLGAVKAGEQIGEVARDESNSCGHSSGSHLHLSIMYNEKTDSLFFCNYINPMRFIKNL